MVYVHIEFAESFFREPFYRLELGHLIHRFLYSYRFLEYFLLVLKVDVLSRMIFKWLFYSRKYQNRFWCLLVFINFFLNILCYRFLELFSRFAHHWKWTSTFLFLIASHRPTSASINRLVKRVYFNYIFLHCLELLLIINCNHFSFVFRVIRYLKRFSINIIFNYLDWQSLSHLFFQLNLIFNSIDFYLIAVVWYSILLTLYYLHVEWCDFLWSE